MKIAQDQITAPKPPLVPGPDFSSSSLLVAGTFQYHLGRAAGTASAKQGQEGQFCSEAPVPHRDASRCNLHLPAGSPAAAR